MPQRFLSGMRTIASSRSGCTEKICIRTKRCVRRLRPFHCRSPGGQAHFIEPAYDDKTLFRLDIWITTRAAGRRDHRRLPRVRRRRLHSWIDVGRTDNPVSERLDQTNGVICPPDIDPGMKAPTPDHLQRMAAGGLAQSQLYASHDH